MTEIIIKRRPDSDFEWVSLVDPTLRELAQIAVQYDLHSTSVHDCLEPEHLPKFEQIGDVLFVITRSFDNLAPESGDTARKLTNKVAIFAGKNFLITIHRQDFEYMKIIRNKWRVSHKSVDAPSLMILIDIYSAVVNTYEQPVLAAIEQLERFEKDIFADNTPSTIIQKIYLLRRKASVYKKMLFLFHEMLTKRSSLYQTYAPFMQDVVDNSSRLYYYAEQLYEDVNNLLNIHLSLASHRTNEVMKVLTIFTVFFLPVTFIVGVYGMNFESMPELAHPYGYAFIWGLMITITVAIFLWFRQNGWIRD